MNKLFFILITICICLAACEYGKEISQDVEGAARLVKIDTIFRSGDPVGKLLTWQFLSDREKRQCLTPLYDMRQLGMIQQRPRPFSNLKRTASQE